MRVNIRKRDFSEPPHETEWVEDCKCASTAECVQDEHGATIDIRIITVIVYTALKVRYRIACVFFSHFVDDLTYRGIFQKPDKCPPGKVYCCSDPWIENPTLTCGKAKAQDIEGIKIRPGQVKYRCFNIRSNIFYIVVNIS